MPYRLYFMDASDRIMPPPVETTYVDPDEAILAARAALRASACSYSEVWHGSKKIVRLTRADALDRHAAAEVRPPA